SGWGVGGGGGGRWGGWGGGGEAGGRRVVEIARARRERLGVVRRRFRQPRADVAWLDLGEHRQFADAFEVRRGPFERRGAIGAQVGHAGAGAANSYVTPVSCSETSQRRGRASPPHPLPAARATRRAALAPSRP